MARPGGLGRGLASLIPQKKDKATSSKEINYFGTEDSYKAKKRSAASSSNKKTSSKKNFNISLKSIIQIPVDSIIPNPFQPRKKFDEERLQELADSIKTYGILQPLVVSQKDKDNYELIAGERRLEASKIAGLEDVPVIIRSPKSEEKLELALIENIHRHNLNIIEEAKAYRQLQEKFGFTQEEISSKMGKSRSGIANAIRLLSLPIEIQRALLDSKITEGHAKMILAISNPEKQRGLFELILKDNLSVRQTEAKVKEVTVSSHKRAIGQINPEIKEKEDRLGTALGTKVKIKRNKRGGQISIDFYSQEEFNNLCDRLSKIE